MPGNLEIERNEPVGPSRRAVIGGGIAAGALVWVAPTVLSVSAASAATVAPGVVIDPFTFPDTVGVDGDSTMVIDPIGAASVTRQIITVGPLTTVAVAGGLATYDGQAGGASAFNYGFGSPIDLSGATALTATTAVTGTASFRLFIDFVGGSSFIVDPATTTPELSFDLTGFTPVQLSGVTSFTLRIGSTATAATAQLGPMTAS